MSFSFKWKINLDLAIKHKLLWVKKPTKTLLQSIFFQTIMVTSLYYMLYLFVSIVLKREFGLTENSILGLLILLTVYFLSSLINLNVLYKVGLPNMDWDKIRETLDKSGLKTSFFIEKDKCLVAYSDHLFRINGQIVIIKTDTGFLINQKLLNRYNEVFPIAPFATWRLLRKLKKANAQLFSDKATE